MAFYELWWCNFHIRLTELVIMIGLGLLFCSPSKLLSKVPLSVRILVCSVLLTISELLVCDLAHFWSFLFELFV